MSQEHFNLTVLGTAVTFRHSADMERVREAIALVEERFADQKLRSHGMQSNKDILLTVLALGLICCNRKKSWTMCRIASRPCFQR